MAVKPEVDRVFVCVLSTLPLRVLPPKGDRKVKDRNTPPRQAKPATPSQTKVWEGLKALERGILGQSTLAGGQNKGKKKNKSKSLIRIKK